MNGRYPDTHRSHIEKARLPQCKHVVVEVCTIHKDDKGPRLTRNREKDIFLWAIGQSAITETTKTVRERES